MRAMILAAGRGERMKELTALTPKPLLRIAGKYLIDYSIEALKKFGIHEIVINVCYRADEIKKVLGNGERYGVNIIFSEETEALETGGGIFQALPLLGAQPFVVVSCDIISDYDFNLLPKNPLGLAHLVMVDNRDFHPRGDYCLHDGKIFKGDTNTLTFANIGIYKPELFADCVQGKFRLATVFDAAIERKQVTGEYFKGVWHNIGTPAQITEYESLHLHAN
ncbi:MAG: nucleotidyltransferase family protein [Gammaproteobacteria bacterium]|nr:nucleotidyltransferase family protein [Gammaproteobacteria bacterium]